MSGDINGLPDVRQKPTSSQVAKLNGVKLLKKNKVATVRVTKETKRSKVLKTQTNLNKVQQLCQTISNSIKSILNQVDSFFFLHENEV